MPRPKTKMAKEAADKTNTAILVVKKIGEKTDVLFGSFSATITKQTKQTAWVEIFEYAIGVGLSIPAGKDWTYLRDTLWNNWKKKMKKKSDAMTQTGAGGDDATDFDDLDEAVLEVIGKESPEMIGIRGATESLEEPIIQIPQTPIAQVKQISMIDSGRSDDADRSLLRGSSTKRRADVAISERRLASSTTDRDHLSAMRVDSIAESDLKRRREELKSRHYELTNYKLQLEIYELENRLRLQHKYPVDTPKAYEPINYGIDEPTYSRWNDQ